MLPNGEVDSIEVQRMATPSRTRSALGCKLGIAESLKAQGLCIDHYLEKAFQKLDIETAHSRSGQDVDQQTLEWLLVQVDGIIEALRGENTALEPDKHTKFVELLLGIANLNEYVRHQIIALKRT
jgi:hypothetical protein